MLARGAARLLHCKHAKARQPSFAVLRRATHSAPPAPHAEKLPQCLQDFPPPKKAARNETRSQSKPAAFHCGTQQPQIILAEILGRLREQLQQQQEQRKTHQRPDQPRPLLRQNLLCLRSLARLAPQLCAALPQRPLLLVKQNLPAAAGPRTSLKQLPQIGHARAGLLGKRVVMCTTGVLLNDMRLLGMAVRPSLELIWWSWMKRSRKLCPYLPSLRGCCRWACAAVRHGCTPGSRASSPVGEGLPRSVRRLMRF